MLTLAALTGVGALAAPVATADSAKVTAALTPEGGRITVEAQGLPPPVQLFFSATVEQVVRLGLADVTGEAQVKLHVVQGRPELLTLGLAGDGEVVEVTGKGLRDWSVRQGAGAASGKRMLDVRPLLTAGMAEPRDFELVVRTRLRKPAVPGTVAVLLITPGDAVGFASRVNLEAEPNADFRVTAAAGMMPLNDAGGSLDAHRFYSTSEGRIELKLTQRGAALFSFNSIRPSLVE